MLSAYLIQINPFPIQKFYLLTGMIPFARNSINLTVNPIKVSLAIVRYLIVFLSPVTSTPNHGQLSFWTLVINDFHHQEPISFLNSCFASSIIVHL